MGKRIDSIKLKYKNFYLKHHKFRFIVEYFFALCATFISACLVALAFKAFLSPNVEHVTVIIDGGAGGVSRTIALVVSMFTRSKDPNQVYLTYSIAYFIVNIPLIYLAFRRISPRFAILTLLNVGTVSLLTRFANLSFVDEMANSVACVIENNGIYYQAGILSRTLLGAASMGIGCCIAFSIGSCTGGTDIISYYFAFRKSTNIGRYTFTINSIIITVFTILSLSDSIVDTGAVTGSGVANAFVILLFAILFQLVEALVIDSINRSNRKEQIQIITKNPLLPETLLKNIPHAATVVRAKGAFSNEDRMIVYCVVSLYETKGIVNLIRKIDPDSFVHVTSVKQVYGRFFVKPVK